MVEKESGGGKILAGALMNNTPSAQKLENTAHELFHAFQHENGQGGASINNELGAYLFGQAVAMTGAFGGVQVPNRTNEKQGQIYGETYNYLLYEAKKVDFRTLINYSNALLNFKAGSSSNVTGLYNNFPLVKPTQSNPVLFKLFPLIR